MAHESTGRTLGPSRLNRLEERQRVRGQYRVKSYRLGKNSLGVLCAEVWLTDGEGQLQTFTKVNVHEVGRSILDDTAVQVEFHTEMFHERLVGILDSIDSIVEPPVLMPIRKRYSGHVEALLRSSANEAMTRRLQTLVIEKRGFAPMSTHPTTPQGEE